ncbi:MAG: hypothetical protein V4671_08245 [Armatimonadota bacterium]
MSDSDSPSRPSKKGGNALTIVALLLVVAAIGLIGYYGFIETGTARQGKPLPPTRAIQSTPTPPASPSATPLSRPL